MNSMILLLISLLPAGVISFRCIHQIAHLDHLKWRGCQLKFTLFSLSVAMTFAGAIGTAVGWEPGNYILLFGAAGLILFDRRRRVADER